MLLLPTSSNTAQATSLQLQVAMIPIKIQICCRCSKHSSFTNCCGFLICFESLEGLSPRNFRILVLENNPGACAEHRSNSFFLPVVRLFSCHVFTLAVRPRLCHLKSAFTLLGNLMESHPFHGSKTFEQFRTNITQVSDSCTALCKHVLKLTKNIPHHNLSSSRLRWHPADIK